MKYKSYTQKEKELPPLVDNKVFQPVRNMIIRTVLDMNDFSKISEPEFLENSDGILENFQKKYLYSSMNLSNLKMIKWHFQIMTI